MPLAGLICLVWWALNWLLSLAGVFAVRNDNDDDEDAVGAISAAVTLCRERTGAVFAVSIWTGLAHLVAFVGATTVASLPLGLAGVLPWRLVVVAVILMTLAYFAVADWLYMARLAGYVCIAEMPEALLAPLPPAPPPIADGTAASDHDRPRRTDPERLAQSCRRDLAGSVSAGGISGDGERDVASNVSADGLFTLFPRI